ncbi:MAG: DUF3604 domain-containing protein [Holophagales bacterium]|nr:DUF3604 domain-containing protein [Holophagales bacterium]MYC10304.1 DUF3604 domain-containing protein [Holophagales bacterium]
MRPAFFGDLHVHTAYSFDAFSFATRTIPLDGSPARPGHRGAGGPAQLQRL